MYFFCKQIGLQSPLNSKTCTPLSQGMLFFQYRSTQLSHLNVSKTWQSKPVFVNIHRLSSSFQNLTIRFMSTYIFFISLGTFTYKIKEQKQRFN